MQTKYLVLAGPHYPPAVHVEATADFCLVAQSGCQMTVLLARTVPKRYVGSWRTRMRNLNKGELDKLAEALGGKESSALLVQIAKEREVQVNCLPKAKVTPPKGFWQSGCW